MLALCRSGVALSLVLLVSAEVHAGPLCDLTELVPMVSGDLVVSPDGKVRKDETSSTILIPCVCDVDPGLRRIASADPRCAAQAAIDSGNPQLLGVPMLGGLWPIGLEGEQYDLLLGEGRKRLVAVPGMSEEIICFEQQKLSLAARSYAETYNRIVAEYYLRQEPVRSDAPRVGE